MRYLYIIFLVIFFVGCSSNQLFKKTDPVIEKVRIADYNEPYAKTDMIYQNLNGAIDAIADELFVSNINKKEKTSVILTSFVDLDNFEKTTTFGRILGESLFNELHIRNFKIIDFRGQDAVSVNSSGEFHITRDVNKLKDHIEFVKYIVVGTYVKFEHNSILINARILDSESGEVISTARVIYKPDNCKRFNLCFEDKKKNKPLQIKEENDINIISDN